MRTVNTRQFGQILHHYKPVALKGYWKCPKHPRVRLGETESIWSKGDCAHGPRCGPSLIVYPALGVTVDLRR